MSTKLKILFTSGIVGLSLVLSGCSMTEETTLSDIKQDVQQSMKEDVVNTTGTSSKEETAPTMPSGEQAIANIGGVKIPVLKSWAKIDGEVQQYYLSGKVGDLTYGYINFQHGKLNYFKLTKDAFLKNPDSFFKPMLNILLTKKSNNYFEKTGDVVSTKVFEAPALIVPIKLNNGDKAVPGYVVFAVKDNTTLQITLLAPPEDKDTMKNLLETVMAELNGAK